MPLYKVIVTGTFQDVHEVEAKSVKDALATYLKDGVEVDEETYAETQGLQVVELAEDAEPAPKKKPGKKRGRPKGVKNKRPGTKRDQDAVAAQVQPDGD